MIRVYDAAQRDRNARASGGVAFLPRILLFYSTARPMRVWRSARIARLLAIAVIGSDEAFAIKIEKLRDDADDAC